MAASGQRRSSRDHPPIGDRLRAERSAKGLSLRELAERLNVSPSLISQIENGRARPSVSTLYAIATELGVSLDDLLFLDADRPSRPSDPRMTERGMDIVGAGGRPGPVQRVDDRKRIRLASGVVWERLTTVSEPDLEFLHVTYEVGGASSPEHAFQRHGGREWGYVVSGHLHVTIGFDDYELGPGDAISIPSTVPHRLVNHGKEPVHAIWFVIGRNSSQAGSTAGQPLEGERSAHQQPPRRAAAE
ncbi:MAG TPA: XRE family transcriptional regulator [Candidatus Limnocylindrales bacterium]|nr:XRE family transcriptional regulator [Candidatus Limnocylindrales bacterium]